MTKSDSEIGRVNDPSKLDVFCGYSYGESIPCLDLDSFPCRPEIIPFEIFQKYIVFVKSCDKFYTTFYNRKGPFIRHHVIVPYVTIPNGKGAKLGYGEILASYPDLT